MNAPDQVRRLLALVPYLLKHPGASVESVADAFSITASQVVDDLNVIYWCGLPGLGYGDLIEIDLEAVEGSGVINLSNADYLARPLRLTTDEAAALIMGLRTLRDVARAAERRTIDSTLAKLTAVAGDAAVVANQADVRVGSADEDIRDTVGTALAEQRQLELTYDVASRAETTVRAVDPMRVRVTDGYVYLDAWCHLAGGLRSFRLDRIAAAEVLQTPAEPHDTELLDPDLGWFDRFAGSPTVTLDLAPQAYWVAEYYPTQGVPVPRNRGKVLRATFPVVDPAWLRHLLLRLADGATVVDPPEAGDSAGASAREALEQYAALFPSAPVGSTP